MKVDMTSSGVNTFCQYLLVPIFDLDNIQVNRTVQIITLYICQIMSFLRCLF